MAKKYGLSEVGCYIDGAYGDDHARKKLSDMVRPWNKEIADELDSDAGEGEFSYEIVDDATDILNREAVTEAVYFEWDCGDLCLFAAGEEAARHGQID